MSAPPAYDDEQLLTILDLIERCGLTATDVAARFGTSRGSILGSVKRIRDDLAKSEAAPFPRGQFPAIKRGNRDGDLGPLWWKRAAVARGVA